MLFSLGNASVRAATVEQRFSSCEKLRDSFGFFSGVAKDTRSVGLTGARVDAQVYASNQFLDKDGDGVACEHFVYDSAVTTRSPGFTSMYSACKIARQARDSMMNVLNADYPYYNEKFQLWFWMEGDMRKLPLVRSAAKINSVFGSALKAAERELKISTAVWQSWPKNPWTPASDFNFDNWCTYFGIYESRPGLLPPIKWNQPRKSLTALNGARSVCKRLFWASSDRVMYSEDDAITLMECDSEASRISRQAYDYYGARNMMIDYVFEWHEYWCWGKECITRFDLDF